MARIQVPTENVYFKISKEDGISIVDSQMGMSDTDENAPAKCDLCSIPLGSMKDIKHLVSPEKISNAVKKGYRPEKLYKQFRDMLMAAGEKEIPAIMEAGMASWKELVDKGETPWALCGECYEEIKNL